MTKGTDSAWSWMAYLLFKGPVAGVKKDSTDLNYIYVSQLNANALVLNWVSLNTTTSLVHFGLGQKLGKNLTKHKVA